MQKKSGSWQKTMNEVFTETIYDGSVVCPKCGLFMTPVEAMYTDGKMCPTCRNSLYGKHMKRAMSER